MQSESHPSTLYHAIGYLRFKAIQRLVPVSLCPEVPSWGLSGRAENTTGIFAQCLHDGPEALVPRAIGTARSRAAWQQGLAFVFFGGIAGSELGAKGERESGSLEKQMKRYIYIIYVLLPVVLRRLYARETVSIKMATCHNMSNFCSCSFASFFVCEFDHSLSTSVCWRCRDFFREQQDAQDEDMAWTSVEDGISIPIQSPEEARKILRAVDSEWKLQQSISLPHGVKAGSSDVGVFFLRSFPSCCDLSGLSRGRAGLGPSRNHRQVWRAH